MLNWFRLQCTGINEQNDGDSIVKGKYKGDSYILKKIFGNKMSYEGSLGIKKPTWSSIKKNIKSGTKVITGTLTNKNAWLGAEEEGIFKPESIEYRITRTN